MRKVIAWTMLLSGLVGAVLGFAGVIAPSEPPWILQLSLAAIWGEGLVMVLGAHGAAAEAKRIHTKLDALLLAHGCDDWAGTDA